MNSRFLATGLKGFAELVREYPKAASTILDVAADVLTEEAQKEEERLAQYKKDADAFEAKRVAGVKRANRKRGRK